MGVSTRTVAVLTAVALSAACARERPPQTAESRPEDGPAVTSPAPDSEEDPPAVSEPGPRPDSSFAKRYDGAKPRRTQHGQAAYYSDALAGHRTANGERYDPRQFTAAHRSFPFGTIVRVVRRDNGKHTYVRITDRGPFGSSKRIIDLSRAAAERLGIIGRGVADVKIEVVEWGPGKR